MGICQNLSAATLLIAYVFLFLFCLAFHKEKNDTFLENVLIIDVCMYYRVFQKTLKMWDSKENYSKWLFIATYFSERPGLSEKMVVRALRKGEPYLKICCIS